MLSTFSFPTRILFGSGAIEQMPLKLALLDAAQPLIVTDHAMLDTPAFAAVRKAGGEKWPVFSGVHPNPTVADVEAAAEAYLTQGCDSVVAVGGGSAMDAGKALRLRVKEPQLNLSAFESSNFLASLAPCLMVPTTAGTGSEVGRAAVLLIDKVKKILFHPALLADWVILDPQLTVGLPPGLTAATGADALTHCIESFTSPVFNPMCDGIALEGIRLITEALPRAVAEGADLEARGKMQVAAMMGGVAFQKDLGGTHALAHPLSALRGLHHGTANALCLPAVMEFNAAAKPGIYKRIGESLGIWNADDRDAIAAVRDLLREVGLAGRLGQYGVSEADLPALADQAFADTCRLTNPIPMAREDLYRLYQQAL